MEWEQAMRKYIKKQLKDILALMQQAHLQLKTDMEDRNREAAAALLEDCQSSAISVGNAIEEAEGNGTKAVRLLEDYCEKTYEIHEGMLGNTGLSQSAACQELETLSAQIMQELDEEIPTQIVAVFLPYKASMWDALESVYEAAAADPLCEAYVIPIPYYDKKADGTLGQMHYEGKEYPPGVPVTDYQDFDFGKIHPDMIFIHNPYDEYNTVTSVHPFFYSKNLKKMTDMLVYIPYFVLGKINPCNAQEVQGMAHFCKLPGVVNADRVIVESEDMRQAYISVLTQFMGPETKERWEEKILGLGSPKYDKVRSLPKQEELPEEWKNLIYRKDGTRKKVVLYNIGVTGLLEHGEALIKKMESVFKTFEEQKDEIVLWFRPHPLIEATIQSMRPGLSDEYQKVFREYQEAGWGILDTSTELERAIRQSDAYYGDPSSLVHLCQEAGMPVMIQNPDIL